MNYSIQNILFQCHLEFSNLEGETGVSFRFVDDQPTSKVSCFAHAKHPIAMTSLYFIVNYFLSHSIFPISSINYSFIFLIFNSIHCDNLVMEYK